MKAPLFLALCFFHIVLCGDEAEIIELKGKVVGVRDGDSVDVLVRNRTVKIRLLGIDAPEAKQSFGTKAREALSKLVDKQDAVVETIGEDQYGRKLGILWIGETNINQKLVADGWAWHFKKYSDDEDLARVEEEARKAKRGLWSELMPLAPWEFRARQSKEEDFDHAPKPNPAEAKKDSTTPRYWLNTSSNVRHNSSCEHFSNTKKGRYCTATEGKDCGKCGG